MSMRIKSLCSLGRGSEHAAADRCKVSRFAARSAVAAHEIKAQLLSAELTRSRSATDLALLPIYYCTITHTVAFLQYE